MATIGNYDIKRTKQLLNRLRIHLCDLIDTMDSYLTQ